MQASVGILGILALFLGRLPGGLVGVFRRIPIAFTRAARAEFERVRQPAPEPEPLHLQPTTFARAALNGRNGHAGSTEKSTEKVP